MAMVSVSSMDITLCVGGRGTGAGLERGTSVGQESEEEVSTDAWLTEGAGQTPQTVAHVPVTITLAVHVSTDVHVVIVTSWLVNR